MLSMLLEGGVIHYNVVQVYDNKAVKNGWRIMFMSVQNVAGALLRPNNIMKNSKDPYLVMHVVFGSSPLTIQTWQ